MYVYTVRVRVRRAFRVLSRGVPHAEYRDGLSRTRATRAAATSGLWTGWHQSTRSVLYLRISHSRGRASALVLARSPARTAARRSCTRAIPPRPRGLIFFFFLPRRGVRGGGRDPRVAPCPREGTLSVGALGARTNGRSGEGSSGVP